MERSAASVDPADRAIAPAAPARRRIPELDTAKGLAILLVVYGHVVATNTLLGNDWYWTSKVTVYMFHMPFFMFISGIVAGVSYPRMKTFADYRAYVGKKFERLVPAYLLFASVVLVGKSLLSGYAKVDNLPPPSLLKGLAAIVMSPRDSSAEFLWFIYVLFLFYLTLPVFMVLARGKAWRLILFGLSVQFIDVSKTFAMDRYCYQLLFFLGGVALGGCYDRVVPLIDRGLVLWWALFAWALALARPPELPNLWVALASVPALFALARLPVPGRHAVLPFLARMAFPIYLMNTMAIGAVKAVGLKLVSWDGPNFLFYLPVLFAAGLLIPIVVKLHVFSRIPVLAKITD